MAVRQKISMQLSIGILGQIFRNPKTPASMLDCTSTHWCFFMEEISSVLALEFDLEYSCADFDDQETVHDYIGKLEVNYDGELFGVDRWEAKAGEDLSECPIEGFTLLGSDQALTLALGILALLEVYDEIDAFNGKDLQERYKQMVSAAKDAHDKKAASSADNG